MFIEFCLPVYNEEPIIKERLLTLLDFLEKRELGYEWTIVPVINGSSDRSYEISSDLSEKYPKIITRKSVKKGKGAAIRLCWKNSKAEIVVFMDADLSTSLENIDDLIEPLLNNRADMTIGTRHHKKSDTSRSFIRKIFSQTYNLVSRIIIGHHYSDLQCGFKAIKKRAFLKIEPLIKDENFFFDTELIIFAEKQGYKITEIPVIWEECHNERRISNVKPIKDSIIFFYNLLKLKKNLSQD